VLLSAIRQAVERSKTTLGQAAEMRTLRDRYASLSGREREVMALVVAGLLNKQVGSDLGISEITVKAHRGRMMQKMKANSLAALVIMAARLGLARAPKPYDAL
jgi:FixJ family two-component response regulator